MMQTYSKVTVKMSGIPFEVECWTEHNHSTVYSGGVCIFDGYKPEACMVIKKEVEKLENLAKAHGMEVEIIR